MTSSARDRTQRPRLGRPPAADSAETRNRILTAARACFAELGYEATTNRALAARAGITTGAIYHYFDSKLDTFAAVDEEVRLHVFARLGDAATAAAAAGGSFVDQLIAVLDASHELNREDPTLARFLGSARVDAARHPELRSVMSSRREANHRLFFAALVDGGIERGEIRAEDHTKVMSLISVITAGLTDAVSHDLELQRGAIDAIEGLMRGALFT